MLLVLILAGASKVACHTLPLQKLSEFDFVVTCTNSQTLEKSSSWGKSLHLWASISMRTEGTMSQCKTLEFSVARQSVSQIYTGNLLFEFLETVFRNLDMKSGAHKVFSCTLAVLYKRWFKYDQDKLWLVYIQIVPVIFQPPCIYKWTLQDNIVLWISSFHSIYQHYSCC
jgi:hypothetical protein